MGGNQLAGSLPTWLSARSASLQVLDVSANRLSGTLPADTLSQLTSLQSLDLSSNTLTGTVSSKLSSLAQVTFLSLASNRLTGGVPAALSALASANVSFAGNQLVGVLSPELDASFPAASSAAWAYNCIIGCIGLYVGCNLQERAALVDLYLSTTGDGWTTRDGWLTGAHPCAWFGVACSADNVSVWYADSTGSAGQEMY